MWSLWTEHFSDLAQVPSSLDVSLLKLADPTLAKRDLQYPINSHLFIPLDRSIDYVHCIFTGGSDYLAADGPKQGRMRSS